MAMNKKELEMVEQLKTRLALRSTGGPIEPDLPPPTAGPITALTKGFLFNVYSMRVDVACSSSIYHSFGRDDKTTTQGCRSLYSTRLLALKALRVAVEEECAKKLRSIDKMIESEEVSNAS